MKFTFVILVVFVAAFALPLLAVQSVRRAWQRGRKTSAAGCNGAVFATLILRRAQVTGVGVVEGGRLFHERFDLASRDIRLSREVYGGRTLAALASAALCAGHAVQCGVRDRAYARLVYWDGTLRIIVNALPVVAVLFLLHPAMLLRGVPALGVFCLLLAVVQVLTFPSVRAAAVCARKIIIEHQLLPPAEMEDFQKALKGATERHLAAPVLECFWVRWLVGSKN
jgi:Zn-dependent membrane protease YugP